MWVLLGTLLWIPPAIADPSPGPYFPLGDGWLGGDAGFEHHHLGTQAAPDATQLQADDPGTDDAQAFGYFGKLKRSGRIDNLIAVDWRWFDVDRNRARCKDHVLGL